MNRKIKIGIIIALSLVFLITAISCAAEDDANEPDNSGDNQPTPTEHTAETDINTDNTGSSDLSDGSEDTDAASDNTGTDDEPDALSLEDDLGISVDGEWFPVFRDVTDLVSAFGPNYNLYVADSCVFEGEDKEFEYDGFYIFTNPNGDWGEKDIWYSLYIESDTLSTSRGISVGATLEDVIAAYGNRFFWEGDNVMTFSLSGIRGDAASPCIQFIFSDNIVIAIEIYYPTNVT